MHKKYLTDKEIEQLSKEELIQTVKNLQHDNQAMLRAIVEIVHFIAVITGRNNKYNSYEIDDEL